MTKLSLLIKEVRNLKREIKNNTLYRRRIYTIKEVSKVIGVSESYIQKLVASKQIPHSKPSGKLIFIRRRDLENFLMKNYVSSEDDIDTIVANKLLELKTR